MLEFVNHVVDYSVGVPLLLVCTARPELLERDQQWGGGKRNSTTLALSPLSGTETAMLIQSLLEEAVLPAETQAALIERSGGNPLYTEEYIRMLMDRGSLQRDGRAWRLVAGDNFPLPDNIQSLIAARIDTLPAERKRPLHDAAVMGKVFWDGAVASMGDQAVEEARSGLHDLSRKEMIRPFRASSFENQAEFAFWHALVRDVAYSQIPRAERVTKHRLAAHWIEVAAGERASDHAEVLAHHYAQARELARATGLAESDDDIASARQAFVLATNKAMNLDVNRALELFQMHSSLSPHALLGWGRGALGLGDSTEAEERLSDTRKLFARMKATPIISKIDSLLKEASRKTS